MAHELGQAHTHPEKAKFTVSIVVNTPPQPLGHQPFL